MTFVPQPLAEQDSSAGQAGVDREADRDEGLDRPESPNPEDSVIVIPIDLKDRDEEASVRVRI